MEGIKGEGVGERRQGVGDRGWERRQGRGGERWQASSAAEASVNG